MLVLSIDDGTVGTTVDADNAGVDWLLLLLQLQLLPFTFVIVIADVIGAILDVSSCNIFNPLIPSGPNIL